jgi:hypothetical protein
VRPAPRLEAITPDIFEWITPAMARFPGGIRMSVTPSWPPMRTRTGWPTQARQAADRSSTSADTVSDRHASSPTGWPPTSDVQVRPGRA